VIEDVVTTGGALIAAVGALRAAGLAVERALCVLDREEGGAEGLAAVGVQLDPLFRRADLGISAG
jgi:orotate phosphoribosyltransferase